MEQIKSEKLRLPPIKPIIMKSLAIKRARRGISRETCANMEIICSMIDKLAKSVSAPQVNEDTAKSYKAIEKRDHDEIARRGLKRLLKK